MFSAGPLVPFACSIPKGDGESLLPFQPPYILPHNLESSLFSHVLACPLSFAI